MQTSPENLRSQAASPQGPTATVITEVPLLHSNPVAWLRDLSQLETMLPSQPTADSSSLGALAFPTGSVVRKGVWVAEAGTDPAMVLEAGKFHRNSFRVHSLMHLSPHRC